MPELTQESAYQLAIRRLYERINYEKTGHAPYSDANYRLDRIRRLLAELDDPHLACPVIHIAGTKGKGSTATLLSHMLSANGLRTGLYTSPHLKRLEERFQINNCPCSDQQLIDLVELTHAAADRVEADGGGKATFFELTTAVAFLHFARANVEAVVLEVGLGGRLDSTNVCEPTLCVITTIGLDHQAQLGNTIALIAGEKAGIIKHRVPVVSSARHPDARQVISERAASQQAPLRLFDRDFTGDWQPINQNFSASVEDELQSTMRAEVTFRPQYAPTFVGHSTWQLSMLGPHHLDNLSAALATIDWLAEKGWRFNHDRLREAVRETSVTARLQIVGHNPTRLIDTAHNADSMAATVAALETHFSQNTKCFILATSRDKDVDSILKQLMPKCERLVLTQYQLNPRGLPIEELMERARAIAGQLTHAPELYSAATPTAAWQLAQQVAHPTDLICATGSFFLAAELL